MRNKYDLMQDEIRKVIYFIEKRLINYTEMEIFIDKTIDLLDKIIQHARNKGIKNLNNFITLNSNLKLNFNHIKVYFNVVKTSTAEDIKSKYTENILNKLKASMLLIDEIKEFLETFEQQQVDPNLLDIDQIFA